MMKKLKVIALSLMLTTLMFAPVLAQGNLNNASSLLKRSAGQAGVQQESPDVIVGTVINTFLTTVGLIFLLLMIYAGYLWMTARGEEAQVDKAKKIISNSLIGIVVVLSAFAITTLITSRLEAAG
ncbi:MAG: hypothetical protein HOE53_00700 [Candidatus Magasanikbacteria bacterium]|jgi:cytochrome bd-type quinol oxidase subunit 2|nr:hypothetical protein [Candidatus Magasanikbacteria bacterium]